MGINNLSSAHNLPDRVPILNKGGDMKTCGRCGQKIKRGEQAIGSCGIWIHFMPLCEANPEACSKSKQELQEFKKAKTRKRK